MTNCIVIHGCPSYVEKGMDSKTRTYDKHWIPWLKKQLISNGIPTQTPLMPDPWEPDYEKFKSEFEKHNVSEDTILIGHSCGCAFLVRWLGETKKKVSKLILVAPWKVNDVGDKFRRRYNTFCAEVDQTDTQVCEHYRYSKNASSTLELPYVYKYVKPIHEFMKHIYGQGYYRKTPEELREILTKGYETKKRS